MFGPESVGKTSLSTILLEEYKAQLVPEVARSMVFDSDFTEEDIIAIGHAQTNAVEKAMLTPCDLLICDTDLITTQLYAHIYLHSVPEVLYQLERKVSYDHYFLFDVDVPWVADGLRDLGHRRSEIFEMFKKALEIRGIAYTLVHGDWPMRIKIICDTLAQKFNLPKKQ